jgi:hypothetical protein
MSRTGGGLPDERGGDGCWAYMGTPIKVCATDGIEVDSGRDRGLIWGAANLSIKMGSTSMVTVHK